MVSQISTALTFVTVILQLVATKEKIPDYFKICHRSDPEINSCIKESITSLKPYLIKGIPKLNIIPIDPLYIPRMELSNEGSGGFTFRNVLKNLTIYGLKEFRVAGIKTDMNKYYMEMDLRTPFMRFVGEYEIGGRILLLPISGEGECEYNFTDVRTTSMIQGKLVNRKGEDYFEVVDLKWDIDVKMASSRFENLFNGNKVLGDATNKFLNDNWEEAFKTYKHLPEEAFGVLFKDLANRVFRLFPYKDLFPE